MSRHASLDDLASFIEGILKPRKSGKIASHLAGCSLCSGHVQDLQQVPAMLANTAYPPIPDQLSVRIEAAIASESVTRVSVQPGTAGSVSGGPVSGEAGRRDLPERARPARRRWRMPGFSSPLAGSLAAVGAAVIVAGGGYEIASHVGGASSTGSSSAHEAVPGSASAGRAAAAPARNGPALNVQQSGQSRSISSIETNTNFVPGTLLAQAQAALRAERATKLKAAAGALPSPYPMANAAGGVSAAQLSKCVSKVAGGRQVLLVDIARYQGKPARIIVVGTPPDGPGSIYAVGASCSASNPNILAQQPLPAPSP
jgi:hypothetical protein